MSARMYLFLDLFFIQQIKKFIVVILSVCPKYECNFLWFHFIALRYWPFENLYSIWQNKLHLPHPLSFPETLGIISFSHYFNNDNFCARVYLTGYLESVR